MCFLCSAGLSANPNSTGLFQQATLWSGTAGLASYAPVASIGVQRTSDSYVNGLLGGSKWSTGVLTYSFPTLASHYDYSGEAQNGFRALTVAQQTAVEKALAMFEQVSGLNFERITETASEHAQIRFATSDLPQTAWAYMPANTSQAGDVWFNGSRGYYTTPVVGNYGFQTALHEIGHAVGLKHAHETSGLFGVLPSAHRSMEYTVMSYSSYVGASVTAGYTNQAASYAQSLMMDDIAALQALYGANYNTQAGNTTYAWNPMTGEMSINGVGQGAPAGNRVFLTVWDGGGIDTYDFSAYTTKVTVDLNPGQWSTTSTAQLADLHYNGTRDAVGNIANAKLYNKDARSLIENATGGSGNDAIVGNAANNRLAGGAGNDSLTGGAGDDTLVGGSGADILSGGAGYDTIDFSGALAAIAVDLARGGTAGEATGDRYSGIEQVLGSAFNDAIVGSALVDSLVGYDGNDVLTGLGGADILSGGIGSDILTGGAGFDRMTGGAGNDTFDFNLATEIGKGLGGRDIILDFTRGMDRIDLSTIDAMTTLAGNQAFVMLSAVAAFTGAGQIRVRYETSTAGTRTLVEGNVDASLGFDFQIELAGMIGGLTSVDFIL